MNLYAMGALLGSSMIALGSLDPGGLACSTSGTSHSVGEICAALTGIKIKWDYSADGSQFKLRNNGNAPMTGCIVFKDAAGNVQGGFSGTIPAGGAACLPVPAGTTMHCMEEKEDEEEQASDSPAGSSQEQGRGKLRRVQQKGTWLFEEGVFDPNPLGKNVTYRITVDTLQQEHAYAIRDEVSHHGLNAVIPTFNNTARLEVVHYSEGAFDIAAGNLILVVADDDPFEALDLYLNGALVATLADGMPVQAANGWDAVKFVIPQTAFNYDPTPGALWRNDYEIVYRVEGDSQDSVARGSYEYESDL